METNNDNNSSPSQSQQLEDEDRLSKLTDDILLPILGRVSLRMAARTCVLSTRWRHLPWLLPELTIDVKDFLSVPCTEPTEENDMEEFAMESLTKAARSFLADQQRESTISSLHLKIYLISTFLCEVGPLLRLQPEMEELRTSFNKLKKLCLCGIFVEFDILWTTAFLVAAPSIEKLRIEVWEHACEVGELRGGFYGERRTPQWEMCFDGSKNWLLKELEFSGFRSLEQQFTFIRSMLERSPNLQKIILRGDDQQCEDCAALDASLRPSKFPKQDEEATVVERIRDGIFSPEIIFDGDCSACI